MKCFLDSNYRRIVLILEEKKNVAMTTIIEKLF